MATPSISQARIESIQKGDALGTVVSQVSGLRTALAGVDPNLATFFGKRLTRFENQLQGIRSSLVLNGAYPDNVAEAIASMESDESATTE